MDKLNKLVSQGPQLKVFYFLKKSSPWSIYSSSERGNLHFMRTQTIMSDGLMAFLRSYFIHHRNVGHKLTTIASVLNGKSSNIWCDQQPAEEGKSVICLTSENPRHVILWRVCSQK